MRDKILIFVVVMSALIGCAKRTNQGALIVGGGPTIPPATPAATSPVTVEILTAWENTPTVFESHGMCTIDPSVVSPGGPAVPCTITVPEGKLFFSRLRISTTFNPAFCEIGFFFPYYYQRAAFASFIPEESENAVDCTKPFEQLPVECFNGIAPQIVPDFPDFVGFEFLALDLTPHLFDLPKSANELELNSNRFYVNTLSGAVRGLNLAKLGDTIVGESGDGYVGGSMKDYVIRCTDRWLDSQYSIVLTLSDEDTEGPPTDPDPDDPTINHAADWNSVFDPSVVGSLTAVCGNSIVELGEGCDDGNTTPGDGCDASCAVEPPAVCGNSVVELGETCDDGNTTPGDGCDATCQTEP